MEEKEKSVTLCFNPKYIIMRKFNYRMPENAEKPTGEDNPNPDPPDD